MHGWGRDRTDIKYYMQLWNITNISITDYDIFQRRKLLNHVTRIAPIAKKMGHASNAKLVTTTIWRKEHASVCVYLMPSQIAKFVGPTWSPPGSCWPQMGTMLAPWTLLSKLLHWAYSLQDEFVFTCRICLRITNIKTYLRSRSLLNNLLSLSDGIISHGRKGLVYTTL